MTDNTIPILNKSFEDLLQEIDINTRELPAYFVNTNGGLMDERDVYEFQKTLLCLYKMDHPDIPSDYFEHYYYASLAWLKYLKAGNGTHLSFPELTDRFSYLLDKKKWLHTYSNHTFAADIKLEKIQAYDRIRLQEFYTQWCHKFDVYHNRITSNVTDITQSLLSIYSKDVYGCVGINYGARFTFNKIVKDNLLCIYENGLFEIPDANHYKDTYFKKTFPILIVDKQLTLSFYRYDCHMCYFHFN